MTAVNLNSFKPKKEGREESFVSEEHNRKHIGENPNRLMCRQYKVDDYIFYEKDGKKCDYILINDTGKDAYFIELKGSDIERASKQIESTIDALQSSLQGYNLFRRIICSKACTHKINGSVITRWKTKHPGTLHGQKLIVIKENSFSEIMIE